MTGFTKNTIALAGGAALALAGGAGTASTYLTEQAGDYLVRCSTVRSDTLPDMILKRYALAADEERGVLSCVVQRADEDASVENVQANVSVRIENLMGVGTEPQMRELLDDDSITYLTSYEIPVDTVLRFNITVSPRGSDVVIPLTFTDDKPWE